MADIDEVEDLPSRHDRIKSRYSAALAGQIKLHYELVNRIKASQMLEVPVSFDEILAEALSVFLLDRAPIGSQAEDHAELIHEEVKKTLAKLRAMWEQEDGISIH